MLAFGAGTLPLMIGAGLSASRVPARPVPGACSAGWWSLLGVVGLAHLSHSSGLVEYAIAVCFPSLGID